MANIFLISKLIFHILFCNLFVLVDILFIISVTYNIQIA